MENRNQEIYVVVIGAAALDITGYAGIPLKHRDSTPGHISMETGGVGRNIAENLAWMGIRTELICVLGNDWASQYIRNVCVKAGVSLTYSLQIPDAGTPQYMAISDTDGDMAWAVSSMEAISHITPSELEIRKHIIAGASVIVADGNLAESTLQNLASNFPGIPLFVDPVSAAKVGKLLPVFKNLHTLKLNSLEAQTLTDIPVYSKDDATKAGEILVKRGLKRFFLTMGGQGVYWHENGQEGFYPLIFQSAVSATGAGDAFMAGLIYSYLKNFSLRHTLQFSTLAASIALRSSSAVNPEMANLPSQVRFTSTS